MKLTTKFPQMPTDNYHSVAGLGPKTDLLKIF